MFDFFEGLIEKLGVKLISDFTDKIYDWIKDIKKNSNGDNNDNGEDYAKIGSSGDSKNSYVWEGNIPEDIDRSLQIIY